MYFNSLPENTLDALPKLTQKMKKAGCLPRGMSPSLILWTAPDIGAKGRPVLCACSAVTPILMIENRLRAARCEFKIFIPMRSKPGLVRDRGSERAGSHEARREATHLICTPSPISQTKETDRLPRRLRLEAGKARQGILKVH